MIEPEIVAQIVARLDQINTNLGIIVGLLFVMNIWITSIWYESRKK